MPILTDFDPLNMNICIFNAFDLNDIRKVIFVTVELRAPKCNDTNNMTEWIFNA